MEFSIKFDTVKAGSSVQYIHMGLFVTKPVFGGLQTTKVQTSMCIHTVRSAPLLFTYWKVSYRDLL